MSRPGTDVHADQRAEAGPAVPISSLRYVGDCRAAYARATSAAGEVVDRRFAIGPFEITLRFAGSALADALWPAFAHLALAPTDARSLTFCVWDGASTGVAPPALSVPDAADGMIVRYADARVRLRREMWGALSVVDSASATGFYWAPSPQVPEWERAAPMRSALHLALSRRGCHLIHAAAVGIGGTGVLLAGPSGAGKSTAAVACLEAGFEFLGDDFVLVDTTGAPTAHSVYGTAKLGRDALARLGLPGVGADSPPVDDDKVVLFVREQRPTQLRRALAIEHVVLPRITDGRAALRAVSAAEALRVVAPSTIFALSDGSQELLATAAELVRLVPCHVLELGPHPRDAPRLLEGLIEHG